MLEHSIHNPDKVSHLRGPSSPFTSLLSPAWQAAPSCPSTSNIWFIVLRRAYTQRRAEKLLTIRHSFQVPKQMSPVVMVRRRWSLTLCVRVAQTFNQMASGSIHHTSQYFFSRPVCILIANQLELSVPSSHNFHPSQGMQARLEQTQQLHHLMRGSFNTSVYAK